MVNSSRHWMRQTCLDGNPPVPVNFLDLASAASSACGHGANLNQIARQVNASGGSEIDRVQVIASLMAIDADSSSCGTRVLEKGS